MKVLYDSNIFDYQRYGGASKCFCEVLRHYPDDAIYELPLKLTKNVHLVESGLFSDNAFNQYFQRLSYLIRSFGRSKPSISNINRAATIKTMKKGDFDVFHHTFYDDYFLPYVSDKPWVFTIHDMIPDLFPDMFNMEDQWIVCRRELCDRASKIIAISENTKKDLVSLYGVDASKIEVVYHGGPMKSESEYPSVVDSPYILFVGARGAYKNFGTVLTAFAGLVKRYPDIRLVCTGRPFSESETASIESHGCRGKVEQRFVSDYELKCLYSHALCFIYPSLYEGFGLPILEAFAHGCPAVLSDCSCFPEIGGDAALYFDASVGSDSLLGQLGNLMEMSAEERSSLVQKGFDRLSLFTWEKSAAKLTEVYKSVL